MAEPKYESEADPIQQVFTRRVEGNKLVHPPFSYQQAVKDMHASHLSEQFNATARPD